MEVEKINNKSIPLNWGIDSLENIFDIVSGSTPSTENAEFWDGELNWITPNDLNKIKHVYISGSERKITYKGLRNCSAQLIPKNAIVMSSRAPIGYLAIAKQEFTTNQGCKSFILKNFDKHCPVFHYFNLSFNMKQIKDLGTGTTFMEVSKKDLNSVEVSFPKSLNEQLKIADILSTIDIGIEQTEILIAKYKSIKKGLMHDLLSNGIDKKGNVRNPETHSFVEKNGMVVPEDWEVESLEKITDYVDYRGKTPVKYDSGIMLITARNIKFGYIDYETSKEYIQEADFENVMSRGKAEIGDVLITTEAPMGNVAQVDMPKIALAQRVIKYRGVEGILCNDYLANFMLSECFQKQLAFESTGSTVMGIKGSKLHKLKICFPKTVEQQRITEILRQKDKLIESEETNLAKLQKQKQGLMQDLLTGKVRVKI